MAARRSISRCRCVERLRISSAPRGAVTDRAVAPSGEVWRTRSASVGVGSGWLVACGPWFVFTCATRVGTFSPPGALLRRSNSRDAAVASGPSSGGATRRRAGARPATFVDSTGTRSAARCGIDRVTGGDVLGVLVTDWAVATGSGWSPGARSASRSGTATWLWVLLAAGLGVSLARASALG